MKGGAIFCKTDKLVDAERKWDLKQRSLIAESDERVWLEDLQARTCTYLQVLFIYLKIYLSIWLF